MFCMECGIKLLEGAVFCQGCGEKQTVQQSAQPIQQNIPSASDAPSFNGDLRNCIYKIFTQAEGISSLYLFENIPPKKLNTVASTYASSLGSDETLIMLYDNTVFGSAKDGFLITSKRIYTKAQFGSSGLANIDEISGINILQGNVSIVLSDKMLTVNMSVVPKEKQNNFHIVLYETIEALGAKMTPRTTDVENMIENEVLSCAICGNIPPKEAVFCNWCGREICVQQGVPQPAYCHKCGVKEGESSEVCRACGENLIADYCGNEDYDEKTDVIGTIGSIVDIAGGIRDILR